MGFPTDHLSGVRFLNPGASEVLADIFRAGPAIAVTRRNDIYVKEGYWDIVTNPANTVFWHEVVHTVQYVRFGRYFEELYAAAGVSTSSYERNPFEVQAEELGSALASGFKGC